MLIWPCSNPSMSHGLRLISFLLQLFVLEILHLLQNLLSDFNTVGTTILNCSEVSIFLSYFVDNNGLTVINDSWLLLVDVIELSSAHDLSVWQSNFSSWHDISPLNVHLSENLLSCFTGTFDWILVLSDWAKRIDFKILVWSIWLVYNWKAIGSRVSWYFAHDHKVTLRSLGLCLFELNINVILVEIFNVTLLPDLWILLNFLQIILFGLIFHFLILVLWRIGLDHQWVILVRFWKVIEIHVLQLIYHVHNTMTFINHMLLASLGILELPGAI